MQEVGPLLQMMHAAADTGYVRLQAHASIFHALLVLAQETVMHEYAHQCWSAAPKIVCMQHMLPGAH
jgi:hypothetical protein